jgi:hypothetical protein
MEHFLAEILDATSHGDVSDTIRTFIDVKSGTLDYGLIYACPRVLNGLLYAWVFRAFLGIWPSKLDIKSDSDDFNFIVNHFQQGSFYKFLGKEATTFLQSSADTFLTFKASLKSSAIVKQLLFEKLKDRVCTYRTVCLHAYDASETLFQLFCKLVPSGAMQFYQGEQKYIDEFHLHDTNIVTGHVCRVFSDGDGDGDRSYFTCTRNDAIKHVFCADNHFVRMMFDQKVLITIDPTFKSHRGIADSFAPTVTLSSYEILNHQPSAVVWQCPCLAEILHCIPKVASRGVFVGQNTHAFTFTRDSTQSMQLTFHARVRTALYETPSSMLLASKEMFDAYVKILISEFFKLGQHALPADIMACLLDYYRKKGCGSHVERECECDSDDFVASDVCVLLIDNRPNIHSVMSSIISMHNVEKADMVVLTSKGAAAAFYQRFMPHAMILTSDPIINKNGKFNIEDINHVLKDEATWQMLYTYGYKKCIIVQDDGILLRPGVEEFLEYDYVGAPWKSIPALSDAGVSPHMVGNGGLSIRDVAMMLKITAAPSRQTCKHALFNNNLQPIPEDVFFSIEVQKNKGKIPDEQTASRFAMEQVWNDKALGMHKPWPYLGIPATIAYLEGILSAI